MAGNCWKIYRWLRLAWNGQMRILYVSVHGWQLSDEKQVCVHGWELPSDIQMDMCGSELPDDKQVRVHG